MKYAYELFFWHGALRKYFLAVNIFLGFQKKRKNGNKKYFMILTFGTWGLLCLGGNSEKFELCENNAKVAFETKKSKKKQKYAKIM